MVLAPRLYSRLCPFGAVGFLFSGVQYSIVKSAHHPDVGGEACRSLSRFYRFQSKLDKVSFDLIAAYDTYYSITRCCREEERRKSAIGAARGTTLATCEKTDTCAHTYYTAIHACMHACILQIMHFAGIIKSTTVYIYGSTLFSCHNTAVRST